MKTDSFDLKLSKSQVKRIGDEAIGSRISGDAAKRIAFEEEERIKKIYRLAEMVAQNAGRKTVQEEDVRLVYTMEEEL